MKFDRPKIHQKYNGRCAYCGCEITQRQMHIDHIKPRRAGGSDDMDNLNPSCYSCNNYKGGDTLKGFRFMLGHLLNDSRKYLYASKSKQSLAENFGVVTYTNWDGIFYFERIEDEKI